MVTTCPRGFQWSEKKLKCVPEGKEAKDKLMLKNERYFFKEDQDMKKCKPGYRWCSKTNKCIEDTPDKLQGKNLGRGQGEGPMGKPFKEASDLVDLAFDEGFETFVKFSKASKKANKILDLIQNECGCGCGDGEGHMGMHDEEGEEDQYEDAYDAMDHVGPNDIDAVPDQDGEKVYASIRRQLGEIRVLNKESKEEYRKFFQSMLDKYGVNSPAQLDDAKKKEFFDAVDKGWKGIKESFNDTFLHELSKEELIASAAGLVTAGALAYYWYRQDIKSCYKRFEHDKPNLRRCLTHYKYCSRFAQNKEKYEKCLKEKAVKEGLGEGFKTKLAVGSALAGYGTAVMLKRKRCKKKYWNDPEKLKICLGEDMNESIDVAKEKSKPGYSIIMKASEIDDKIDRECQARPKSDPGKCRCNAIKAATSYLKSNIGRCKGDTACIERIRKYIKNNLNMIKNNCK